MSQQNEPNKQRRVIIEKVAMDLGLESRDIQRWLLDKLRERGINDVVITDIDVEFLPNCVAVDLLELDMVDKLK